MTPNPLDIHFLIPPVVAFGISLFSSMAGLSGAFLLLPFQMSFLGIVSPSASATTQLFNVLAIPGGVYQYYRQGRMVWPLTLTIILGTIPGVVVGEMIRVQYFFRPQAFKLFVAAVLFYIVVRLMTGEKGRREADCPDEEIQSLLDDVPEAPVDSKNSPIQMARFNMRCIVYQFAGGTYQLATPVLVLVSFVVGVISGIYGIGGSAFISPLLVSVWGLPIHSIAGAVLAATFLTSLSGMAFYTLLAQYYSTLAVAPHWQLGLLFGVGGFLGVSLGSKMQRHVSVTFIRWILVLFLLFAAGNYVVEAL